ncbi:MAG: uroporphyrinogen decarboxylase family protein [Chloroflexota bacterium]
MQDSRTLVLAHLDGMPVDRLPAMPITMMFASRLAGVPYREYCTDFRALVAGQGLVAERFGVDHVSAISDPAREAVDLGADVTWFEDQPPALDDARALLLADKRRLATLRPADPLGGGRMTDRVRGVEALRAGPGATRLVEVGGRPLRGGCGPARDRHADARLRRRPGLRRGPLRLRRAPGHRLCGGAQVDAGADLIGVGDAAASLVGPAVYREFVLPHERQLVEAIHAMGARVRLHICGNIRRSVRDIATLGADIVDLDSMVPIAAARADAGPAQVLLGNLNPVTELMDATPGDVAARLAACHHEAGSRFIVGAGCEVPPATPHANLEALTSFARGTRPGAASAEPAA